MIKHIVLFRFKNSLAQAEIQGIAKHLLNMEDQMSLINDCKWLENINDRNRDHGFKHGISMQFVTQKELGEYITHPHHVEVCEKYLFPALTGGLDDLLVFDYEEK